MIHTVLSCHLHPPSPLKSKNLKPDSVWYWFANQSPTKSPSLSTQIWAAHIQCINLPCLCLFLGIHSLRRYEARNEPNFCCPIADGFIGAANLLTVSRNRLGQLIEICGYLEVNFSVRMSATACLLASTSAASRKSISSPYEGLSFCKIKDDSKTDYTLY